MGNLEDGASNPDSTPSFNDPMDPRWSQNPHAAPPRNPYSRMPLDAPPINGDAHGQGRGFPGQNRQQQGYPQQSYPQPGYPGRDYPVYHAKPSSVLSIVSLVAGIVAVFSAGMMLVPQLGAIVCGHLALKREPHARGMAIFGLVLGYLMLAFQLAAYLFMFVFIGGIPGL